MESEDSTAIKDAIRKAEDATSEVKDPELRKAAFETVLKHLLAGGKTPTKVSRSRTKTSEEAASTRRKRSGPMTWLDEIIEDSFFAKPKTSKEILAELAERGHNLALNDITDQLQQLAQNRKLRRKKQPEREGGRQVWKYSNW